jgi:hypothetical protein
MATSLPSAGPSLADSTEAMELSDDDAPDELALVRMRLRPPPIPGVTDWGIPPAPEGKTNPEVEVSPSSSTSKPFAFFGHGRAGIIRHFLRPAPALLDALLPQKLS